jgi:hypothetical protein
MNLAKPNPNWTPGYYGSEPVPRDVTATMKSHVFGLYGIGRLRRLLYTIDHLVPLELCGTNNVLNLWPQPKKEARLKDLDENRLATAVHVGKMTLAEAQQEMLQLWGGQ